MAAQEKTWSEMGLEDHVKGMEALLKMARLASEAIRDLTPADDLDREDAVRLVNSIDIAFELWKALDIALDANRYHSPGGGGR